MKNRGVENFKYVFCCSEVFFVARKLVHKSFILLTIEQIAYKNIVFSVYKDKRKKSVFSALVCRRICPCCRFSAVAVLENEVDQVGIVARQNF